MSQVRAFDGSLSHPESNTVILLSRRLQSFGQNSGGSTRSTPGTSACAPAGPDSWFMVYGLWFMVYGLWFMVYGVWCMVNGEW
jgi:hypothetical protein